MPITTASGHGGCCFGGGMITKGSSLLYGNRYALIFSQAVQYHGREILVRLQTIVVPG